jgi:hypothetical protein
VSSIEKRPLQARRAKRNPHKSKVTAPSFLQRRAKYPSPKKGKKNPSQLRRTKRNPHPWPGKTPLENGSWNFDHPCG